MSKIPDSTVATASQSIRPDAQISKLKQSPDQRSSALSNATF